MNLDQFESTTTERPRPDARAGGETQRFGRSLLALLDDARKLARDHTLLAVLEVQRAGISLVKMLSAAVVAAVLAVTAWMALVASLVAWAAGEGTPWWVGLVGAAVANVLLAVALAFWIRSKLPDLMFAATVRQLRGEDAYPEGDG